MASINSLSGSSSSSSIYGNRTYNIISGLASGLDTEQLISGVVQSYQQKIQSLQQKNTKLQWQQEAIQSISDKLVEFDRNYASYVYSDTNLLSSSFFNNAVKTTANGAYAALVSASGKTNSTVVLNAVKQLATATRYTVSGNNLNPNSTDGYNVTGNSKVDLNGDFQLSKLAGSLTINYGDRQVTIDFSDTERFADEKGQLDTAKLQAAIEEKLNNQQISTSSGSMVDAGSLIGVSVDSVGNRVSFYDKSGGGNTVSIAGATGSLKDMISNLDSVVDSGSGTFSFQGSKFVEDVHMADYLAGKSITVSLDGKSKTIELPKITTNADPNETNKAFRDALQAELDKAFGKDKVTTDFDGEGKLTFAVADGSNLAVTSADDGVGEALGISGGITSYLDTTKTLGELGIKFDELAGGYDLMAVGKVSQKKDANGNVVPGKYVDAEGNAVDKDGYRLGQDGQRLQGFDLVINDVKIGTYTRDTELNTIINNINANTEAGVNVSYSKTTGQFVFTAKDTGSGGRVDIGTPEGGGIGLGEKLFGKPDPSGANYTQGTDATFIATINGQTKEFTRASNTFDLDGMSVTVNGTFNEKTTVGTVKDLGADQSVTFTSKTDADTIVEAVKKMVNDLNEVIKAVKSAYSDMPLQKSDGSKYEPLTDDDKSDMTDSAIENYEEKAKTGILFMDSDLSSLYNDLRNAITSSGADGVTLRSIGIETAYSDGLTTITLNEQTLREALESDPDKVQQAFTKSKENGAATDGLMASIKSITDRYASTTGDVKGILIEKAGSKYSPTAALDNTILDQMKDVEEEITKWQDKMSNQVDYYTNKFTQLELLINQMNSQSSALSGLLGG